MYSVELLPTHTLLQVLLITSLIVCHGDDTAATVSIILYLRLIASHSVPEDPSCKMNLKRVYRVDVQLHIVGTSRFLACICYQLANSYYLHSIHPINSIHVKTILCS